MNLTIKKILTVIGIISVIGALPENLYAAEAELSGPNTAWILTSTALVLFMTIPGLAFFYGGLVRSKNVLSVLMQCFALTCMVSILWVVVLYGLVFGDGGSMNSIIGGFDKLFMSGVTNQSLAGDIPETVFSMFQLTFAIITPALIVGGFAERMKFSSMLLFSTLWMIFVYAPIAHMVWGGGWLGSIGFMDFAGGAVVHINAGVAALIAAIMLRERKGFPSTPMPPHNLSMTVAGASMLWVGWFGFNAGSALAADQSAGMAMLVTHIGAAAGSLSWMAREWIKQGKASVLGIVTGMVAGLGTITPASGFVGPMGALFIGIAAGLVCYEATQYIKKVLKIDDSLDVFPVHGAGGVLGTLLTGVFAATSFGGMGMDNAISTQVSIQVIGIIFTILWCSIFTFIILRFVDNILGLRISEDNEETGIDLSEHGESSYNN
ncbi:MAG: ammonium transporter [Gammaproteobacteria bacterium]|nr:ammonium transporter [Gammaproteobacteria bacterium]MBT4462434.1 ammonium transporter [Gammaproteobacteria bacterium]MBT4655361.1 ammonium transporter [Gammaproteobacteria bacterium]MBT5117287.1 ammonium transporter [Gammaproteobacteria bacterium]MBT5762176.1 ammonium transporter [Gammaproteobacteria bacterium]